MKKILRLFLSFVIFLCVIAVIKYIFTAYNIEKSKSVKTGNTNCNLLNSGMAVQRGSWIYYLNSSNSNLIYKMKLDGSHKIKLTNMPCYDINIVGGWIYYLEMHNIICTPNMIRDAVDICKMKLDGSHKTNLTKNIEFYTWDEDYYMNVVGDWIYYKNYLDKNRLYKMKTDGTHNTKLTNDPHIDGINIVGDWIYYQNLSHIIYKIKIDGSKKTKVCNGNTDNYINVAGNWIYFCDYNNHITKIGTDGNNETTINRDDAYKVNVVKNWIYYTSPDAGLYKMQLDGSMKKRLTSDCIDRFNIVSGWIYYTRSPHDRLYRIKTDGTERNIIK